MNSAISVGYLRGLAVVVALGDVGEDVGMNRSRKAGVEGSQARP